MVHWGFPSWGYLEHARGLRNPHTPADQPLQALEQRFMHERKAVFVRRLVLSVCVLVSLYRESWSESQLWRASLFQPAGSLKPSRHMRIHAALCCAQHNARAICEGRGGTEVCSPSPSKRGVELLASSLLLQPCHSFKHVVSVAPGLRECGPRASHLTAILTNNKGPGVHTSTSTRGRVDAGCCQ